MIRLGEVQTLKVIKHTPQGVYLNETEPEEGTESGDILLPKRYVPENLEDGQTMEVFVYRDSEDRMIATTKVPLIRMGEIAWLKVVDVTTRGTFLDWGLERDLFLPTKESTRIVKKGQKCLVGLYVDRTGRLCATMNLYRLLDHNAPYQLEEWVEGTVYDIKKDFGAFIAVDDRFSGLIREREITSDLKVGDTVKVRVVEVREDGKLTLSLRDKAHKMIDGDAVRLHDALVKAGGFLALDDHSDPDVIHHVLGMSKKAFKRAVGRLLRDGIIDKTETGTQLKA
jgi:hypothetical protein